MPFPRPLRPARSPRARTLATGSIAFGAVAGIIAATAIVSSAASASSPADDVFAAALVAATPAGAALDRAETVEEVTDNAEETLDAARAAVADAARVTADVAAAGLDVGPVTTVDTAELRDRMEQLSSLSVLPLMLLPGIADDLAGETRRVAVATASLRAKLEEAQAKKAAEEAAAKAQAEAEAAAAAAAQAAAEALAAANTPEGAKATARAMIGEYGWGGDQFGCLESLWTRESNWNYQAYNGSSGATGIPQALPGSKMASAGSDWQTNATTQIRWGLGYIASVYGTPCNAWGHSNATGWY